MGATLRGQIRGGGEEVSGGAAAERRAASARATERVVIVCGHRAPVSPCSVSPLPAVYPTSAPTSTVYQASPPLFFAVAQELWAVSIRWAPCMRLSRAGLRGVGKGAGVWGLRCGAMTVLEHSGANVCCWCIE